MKASLFSAASAAAGASVVRDALADRDAVDGVVPSIVIEPDVAEGVAATLAWAARDGLATVLRGGGTKDGWGRRPAGVDVLLRLHRLDRVLSHAADDLTVTVEAGARLADVNRRLAGHGQRLPLDPPWSDGATIGGLLATNDAGPLRHRAGTPRDLVIGSRIATTDGRLSRSGGQVVKNVAGYDLSKLLCGSCGTLAAFVSATFKVVPVPERSATIVARAPTAAASARAIRDLMGSQLEPSALEFAAAPSGAAHDAMPTLLIQFASIASAVDAQATAARAHLAAAGWTHELLSDEAESRRWREHSDAIWHGEAMVVRLAWKPAEFADAVGELSRTARALETTWVGRAAAGAGLLRIEGAPADAAALVLALRISPRFGNVVVLRAPADVKQAVDVWGSPGDRGRILASLKQQFDPAGILNAGRGPL